MAGALFNDRSLLGDRSWRASSTAVLLFCLESALGVLAVAALSALTHWLPWLLPVRLALCLLLAAAAALLCGFWQAVVVSCAAVAFLAYWTSGQIRFTPADIPALIVALAAFLLATLMVSRLSAQLQQRAHQAEARGRRMEDLYEFTRRMLQMNLHEEPGHQLADMVHELFALEAVVIFDSDLNKIYAAGDWREADTQGLAQNVYYFGTCDDDPTTGLGRRVVRFGTVPVGSLVVRGQSSPLTNNLIASLISIAFDRYRAFANESHLEAQRRAEQLRATVLDSLAHAYKTPLTAIRAASTGLTEMGKLSLGQKDLVDLIDEQAGLLAELTTKLLMTARLDTEELTIHAAPTDVSALVEEVLDGLRDRLASMKLSVDVPENLILDCDRRLMLTLLTQYVDNACKYSNYGAPITVKVESKRAEMIFSVRSFGSVIPMTDRERIFDRFYRSSTNAGSASGTGIGLSVAKRAALVHGGHVWVTSDELEGTTFFAAIPTSLGSRNRP